MQKKGLVYNPQLQTRHLGKRPDFQGHCDKEYLQKQHRNLEYCTENYCLAIRIYSPRFEILDLDPRKIVI